MRTILCAALLLALAVPAVAQENLPAGIADEATNLVKLTGTIDLPYQIKHDAAGNLVVYFVLAVLDGRTDKKNHLCKSPVLCIAYGKQAKQLISYGRPICVYVEGCLQWRKYQRLDFIRTGQGLIVRVSYFKLNILPDIN